MSGFQYAVLIPIIPFLMFLLIGLVGHKMKPALAGLIGTTGLFISTVLSYITAYQYFFVSGKVDGVYQKIIAFNTVWLQLTDSLASANRQAAHRLGCSNRPNLSHDACGYYHRFVDGAYL